MFQGIRVWKGTTGHGTTKTHVQVDKYLLYIQFVVENFWAIHSLKLTISLPENRSGPEKGKDMKGWSETNHWSFQNKMAITCYYTPKV